MRGKADPTNKISFGLPQPVLTFNASEYDKLLNHLQLIDQSTTMITLNYPEEIHFRVDGRLASNGFTVSNLALRQLCHKVSNGLWRLIADIGGIQATTRGYDQVISVPIATAILNQCSRLRFRASSGIAGQTMLLNHETKSVDGIVGPKYRYLPNNHMLECIADVLQGSDTKMEFNFGVLAGRRLSVGFLAKEPIANDESGFPVFGGCYFNNSEAGECSFRGTTMLRMYKGNGRCINELKHAAHHGKTFNTRLCALIEGVTGDWDNLKTVAKSAAAVLQKPLKLLTDDGTINKARRRQIVNKLARHIDDGLATSIVREAILHGMHDKRASRIAVERNVCDIFYRILSASEGQHPEVSETLERTAFDIIAKKIVL